MRRPKHGKPRQQRNRFDPVACWDGLVSAPNHTLITPDQMAWNARNNMALMALIPSLADEDADAKATPIGGMQYRHK